MAIKNILKYLRRTKGMFLIYGGLELVIQSYLDPSFQSDRDDYKFQSEYVLTFNDGVVSWKSSKQEMIAYSMTEAEYIAASDVVKESV